MAMKAFKAILIVLAMAATAKGDLLAEVTAEFHVPTNKATDYLVYLNSESGLNQFPNLSTANQGDTLVIANPATLADFTNGILDVSTIGLERVGYEFWDDDLLDTWTVGNLSFTNHSATSSTDFQGYDLTSIEISLDSFSNSTFGGQLYIDGFFTARFLSGESPVPEPSALALIAAAVACISGRKRIAT
jgi:hypothetical protein